MSLTKHLSPFRWCWSVVPMLLLGGSAFSTGGAAQPLPQARLAVDLSERTMRLMEGGEVVRTYRVAIGSRRHPTPRGRFRTGAIVWNPSWIPPDSEWAREERPRGPGDPQNPMQGVKIYFRAPSYYIHGTNAPASIGQAASHGCLRMIASEAIEVARWIEENGGSVSLTIEG